MVEDFTARTALVTGAGSGIGRAVAVLLAAGGASLVAFDQDRDSAEAVAAQLRAGGTGAVAVSGDVAEPDDVRRAVQTAVTEFGGLHLALNNAGIRGPRGPVAELDDFDAYRRLIDVNLHSVFYAMHYEIPEMLRAGGGAIVNTSSILGLVGVATALPYAAAKHGVAGMTKAAALGYADQGIRINSIHPGYIETPLLAAVEPDEHDALEKRHPMQRLGTAEEVAELAVFLLSDRASFITGSQHVVDGGYTAQ